MDNGIGGESIIEPVEVTPPKKEKDSGFFALTTIVVVLVVLFLVYMLILTNREEPITGIETKQSGDTSLIAESNIQDSQLENKTDEQVDKLLANANELFVDGNFKAAKETAQEALNLQSSNSRAKTLIQKCEEQIKPKSPTTEQGSNATNIVEDKKANTIPMRTGNDPFSKQMVYIKGGTFNMGSPDTEADRQDDEYQHRVTVSSFFMSKFEVTQAQWQALMGNNPSTFNGCSNCPIETVSWFEVHGFLNKLNQKTGGKYRLPTEAEWEYAARGGTTTPFNTGNCLSTNQANYHGDFPYQSCSKGNNRSKTVAVGSFDPNLYGLYDMHGNVWEWCSDSYNWDYYRNSPAKDPTGHNRSAAFCAAVVGATMHELPDG